MFFSIDDSEVVRAEQRLRDDHTALANARHAVKEQCERKLTRPSTLALLVAVGALAGARSKTTLPAADRRRGPSMLATVLRSIGSPLLKGLTAMAVELALHPREHATAREPSRGEDPENAA